MPERPRSLREELGGASDPRFELDLPRGWGRSAPTPEVEAEMERSLSRRMMESGGAGAAQVYRELRVLLRRSMQEMRDRQVVAFFAPMEDADEPVLPLPASIVATVRHAPSTEAMDGYVKKLIVSDGARPLPANRDLLRLERERPHEVEGQRIVLGSILYVTPVPRCGRRRALELTATYARADDVPRDDPDVRSVRLYLDLMAGSLRWTTPPAA